MSEDFTARLGLPYLAAGQMQKHVTLNAALSRLDALVQTAVISRSVSNQPATPADGGGGAVSVLTLQKRQPRVHASPNNMIVAVPPSQHSPAFGQAASSHTVFSLPASMDFRNSA